MLTLDGGGAKGFYTLGVLREIEGLVGVRLHETFDLIFGTSTGAIIASMLALGHSVDEIYEHYKKHVVSIMALKTPAEKSARLSEQSPTDGSALSCARSSISRRTKATASTLCP